MDFFYLISRRYFTIYWKEYANKIFGLSHLIRMGLPLRLFRSLSNNLNLYLYEKLIHSVADYHKFTLFKNSNINIYFVFQLSARWNPTRQ